jgi:hypothetical protein
VRFGWLNRKRVNGNTQKGPAVELLLHGLIVALRLACIGSPSLTERMLRRRRGNFTRRRTDPTRGSMQQVDHSTAQDDETQREQQRRAGQQQPSHLGDAQQQAHRGEAEHRARSLCQRRPAAPAAGAARRARAREARDAR